MTARCPVDARPLAVVRVQGIALDRCDGCGGVWLDAGEYDAVRAHFAPVRGRSRAKARAAAADGGRVVHVVGEIALETAANGGVELSLRAIGALLAALAD